MNIDDYIESGMIESYVLGLSSPEEKEEMERLLQEHPRLKTELRLVENSFHQLWLDDAVPPPLELRSRALQPFNWADTKTGNEEKKPNFTFIHMSPNQADYITVHKVWKWIFIAAFLLFKLFLFLAIFFYFKYRMTEDRANEREKARQELLQRSVQ